MKQLLAVALLFVWRSFYAMRIPKEKAVVPDSEAASSPSAGEHAPVGHH